VYINLLVYSVFINCTSARSSMLLTTVKLMEMSRATNIVRGGTYLNSHVMEL